MARTLAAPLLLKLLQDAAYAARVEALQGQAGQGGHSEGDREGGGGGMHYAANYDDDATSSAHAPRGRHAPLEAAAAERGPGEAGGGNWLDHV